MQKHLLAAAMLPGLAALPVQAQTPESQASQAPAAVLTLLDIGTALKRVYREHPELWRLRREQQIWQARALQAGLGPNPLLSLNNEDFAGTAAFSQDRFTQFTLELAQTLPLGGRLERARQLALLNQQLAYWDYRVRLQELGQQVYALYAGIERLQAAQVLAQDAIRSAAAMHALLERAVSAGKLAPAALIQSGLELQGARAEAARLAIETQARQRELALLWGGGPDFAQLAPLSLAEPPDFESLRRQLGQHPRLARWDSERSQRDAALAAAQAASAPDLTLAGGLRYHPPLDWGAVLLIELPLPISDANQGHIAEARLRQESWARERELEARQLLARLHQLYDGYQAHAALIEILGQQLALATEQETLARKAFEAGKTGYLEVLAAYRGKAQLQRQLLQAEAERQLARVELLTATGIAFPQEDRESAMLPGMN